MHKILPDTMKFKPNPKSSYYALYQEKDEVEQTMDELNITDPVQKYYNKNKFKYQRLDKDDEGKVIVDKNNAHNKMSYCATCKILRPPRSFHCGTCGCCVEVHDHHCPWVGTCIGPRNVHLFVAFLFFTSLHALVTFIICLSSFMVNNNILEDDVTGLITKAVCVYGGIIFLALLIFASFQIFFLGIRNLASNEDIRHRWNGHNNNSKYVKIFSEQSSCFGKIYHYLFAPVQPSNLQKYAELVELHEQI